MLVVVIVVDLTGLWMLLVVVLVPVPSCQCLVVDESKDNRLRFTIYLFIRTIIQ